jgi:4-hydroxyproline epimerase
MPFVSTRPAELLLRQTQTVSRPKTISLRAIDSHTGGEPTRTIVAGGPDLGDGPLAERRELFRQRHDRLRSAIVCEPRGSDVLVGALLVEPFDPTCRVGAIFFNNVGCLGMCGHGALGAIETLVWLKRLTSPGTLRIDTPVGAIDAALHPDGSASIWNVPAWRKAKGVAVQVPGHGEVVGDVAWGGNWFFLVEEHGQRLSLDNVETLTDFGWRIRQAVNASGYPEVDHVELFAPSPTPGASSRNFVLCPGKAYDRSPCGTGTSAKLACLHADGKLAEGQIWRQESIVGSIFEGSVKIVDGQVIPCISGRAHVTADVTLLIDESDPFAWGLVASTCPAESNGL